MVSYREIKHTFSRINPNGYLTDDAADMLVIQAERFIEETSRIAHTYCLKENRKRANKEDILIAIQLLVSIDLESEMGKLEKGPIGVKSEKAIKVIQRTTQNIIT